MVLPWGHGHAVDDKQRNGWAMNKLVEQLVGVKPPFTQAALFEVVAALIFMVAIFWPHLSMTNLLKGLLIGAIWAVNGFIGYLKALSQSPRQ